MWNYLAGSGLALWLLVQGGAATATVNGLGQRKTADLPAEAGEEAVPPWADLLERDRQQPLLGGEYNPVMTSLWVTLNDQWALRSQRILAACDALGNDMAYLRGRVPRQIEDAHRQMAPFQTKGLPDAGQTSAQAQAPALSFGILPIEATEAEVLLELIRAGDLPTRDTYQHLLWYFLELNLADYLDPAQDDIPLSRGEFLTYVETLDREFQDPTGALERHEEFLREADRLIADLLVMLQEVRRSLAMLEAPQANGAAGMKTGRPSSTVALAQLTTGETTTQAFPHAAIAPLPVQTASSLAWAAPPAIAIDDESPVTRRDFLLAMMGLMASLESPLYRTPWCGGYRVESQVNPAQEMQWEVLAMIRELDILNLEIMALVNARSR